MALTYSAPSITVNAAGAQQLIAGGPAPKTIHMVGTAPQGPDFPVLIDASQAASVFGDPGKTSSMGYTLPYMMYFAGQQRPPTRGVNNMSFLVQRLGVTRSSLMLKDTTGTPVNAIQIQGIGSYAGSAGNNLTVAVTTGGGKVQTITITDSVKALTLQTYTDKSVAGGTYDLSTFQSIVNTINARNPLTSTSSVVQATLQGGTLIYPLAAIAATALAGGADGLSTSSTSVTQTSLQPSLYAAADYVCVGWDAGAVVGAVWSHINTDARPANNFRKAVLGPAAGTSFTTLTGSYNTTLQGPLAIVGHDLFNALHPATGASVGWDGFYLAAMYAGLKATSPTEETCTYFPLSGLLSLPPNTGKQVLLPADYTALGAAGFLTMEQPIGQNIIRVRDAISTAAYSLDGSTVNPFYQFNVQDIDDAVSNALVQAVIPFKARPRMPVGQAVNAIGAACQAALGALGATINGVNYVNVTVDPNTLIPTVSVSYITRFPNVAITINTSYTFA